MFDLEVLMETPATRLEMLMEECGMQTQGELASKLGIDVSSVSKHIKTLKDPSKKPSAVFLEHVETSLGWSSRWIKTGEGERTVASKNKHITLLGEPVYPYQGRTDYNITRQVSSDKPNMWMVPIKAQAGFAKGFIGRTFIGQIKQVPWPMITGECFAFEVEGFSMFPDYKPHDWVICTIIADYDWLKQGKAYVFQTYDGIIIKSFDRVADGKVFLTSANPKADPIPPIDVEELRVVYAIEGIYLKL